MRGLGLQCLAFGGHATRRAVVSRGILWLHEQPGENLTDWRTHWKASYLLAVFAATFLVLAVSSHWPYSFYILMRLTICGASIYLSRNSFLLGSKLWPWVFGGMAVLFNPVLPMRMHRSDWSMIDSLAAVAFLLWPISELIRNFRKSEVRERYGK